MGRPKHHLAFVLLVPLDDTGVIAEINKEYQQIGDKYEISHGFGFISPIDFGKRAMFEYDYYFDHRDSSEVDRMHQAIKETMGMIERYNSADARIKPGKKINNQGFSRMENILYL
jgi:hypothetical protein